MTSSRLKNAIHVVETEAQGLDALAKGLRSDPALAEAFDAAINILLALKGHLIVVGVGKSGHIGQKLAASFASTGTPAFFMHPTEASHGDLGMVTTDNAVLAISNSGQSAEMTDVLHYCRKSGVPLIGITRNPDSALGVASDVVLRLPDAPEACLNGLAPTTSTTNTLALGDALVVATMAEKGITESDFGRHHPGGKLGRGLHTVADWMALSPQTVPTIAADAPMQEVVLAMSAGQNGCVAVLDADDLFVGMITDGDLRRAMGPDMFSRRALDIATREPITLDEDMLMSEVVELLSRNRIATAFILKARQPIGIVNTKTLMTQGYI
jgi:arabinose-5-phosphate isomerase